MEFESLLRYMPERRDNGYKKKHDPMPCFFIKSISVDLFPKAFTD